MQQDTRGFEIASVGVTHLSEGMCIRVRSNYDTSVKSRFSMT